MSIKEKSIANIDEDFLKKLLEKHVHNSVRKTISHLILEENEEKKNQKDLSKKIDKQGLRAEQEETSKQEEKEENLDSDEDSKEDDTTKIKAQKLPETMESEDISRMLNIIRAGKSLKDPKVKERFDAWFGSLSPAEKVALKGFLDGMAQIITGDSEPEKASKPSSPPYNVKMTSASSPKPRKSSPDDKDAQKPSGIDAPIVVGEVNDISEIKKRFFSRKT